MVNPEKKTTSQGYINSHATSVAKLMSFGERIKEHH